MRVCVCDEYYHHNVVTELIYCDDIMLLYTMKVSLKKIFVVSVSRKVKWKKFHGASKIY